MSYRYIVLGSGRQGTAAAYDLARFGDAESILLADIRSEVAQKSAERINSLIGRPIAHALTLDVSDTLCLRQALEGIDGAVDTVPFYFNLNVTRACLETHVHLCDTGGNTEIVLEQLALANAIRQAGVSVVPDCGMGPGLINNMGAYVMDLLDQPREVYLYDAGLPQNPTIPWNYQATFDINGLINEYSGKAIFLRDGQITMVDALTELEILDFPPLGQVEAFVISGSTSTAPFTHLGRLERYESKVLRYSGTREWFIAFRTLGLFSEEAIEIDEQCVIPRHMFDALLEPKISITPVNDICVMRAIGIGIKDGGQHKVIVDLIDRYDENTGFTAMERLTGWHCAMMLSYQVRGQIALGGQRVESALPAATVMAEMTRRGINHTIKWE